MSKKIQDLAVKTGEYTDREGNTKGRWQNVGSVIQSDDGGTFLLLDRWFNPAGIPNPDNRDSVMVSMFSADRNRQGQQSENPAPPADDGSDTPF